MDLHYLEIITESVDAVCDVYSTTSGVSFGEPVPELGNARTAELRGGGRIGVRAPMSEDEKPGVRPYWLVPEIEDAVAQVAEGGGEIIHPPLEIPGLGRFAIYVQGGNQHGLWQT